MTTAEQLKPPRPRNIKRSIKNTGSILIAAGIVHIVDAHFGVLGMPPDTVTGLGMLTLGSAVKIMVGPIETEEPLTIEA